MIGAGNRDESVVVECGQLFGRELHELGSVERGDDGVEVLLEEAEQLAGS